MESLNTFLPITAIVAIVIFFIKEVVEYTRRQNADKRKLQALIALLARECELNYWTIKQLRQIFNNIEREKTHNAGITVKIEQKTNGKQNVLFISHDGALRFRSPISEVHRNLMSKFLLDIATLDKKLFDVMEPAYDALAELEHVRESFITFPEDSKILGLEEYLVGFVDYALDELNDAESELRILYKHCTDKELTDHRLR